MTTSDKTAQSQSYTAPFELDSAGVDWLTATAYRTSGHDDFQSLGSELIERQARIGHAVRPWKSQGYHGLASEGIIAGVRYDTWIVKLSSEMAREHWRAVAEASTNVTRLDLQITLRAKSQAVKWIREQHRAALSVPATRGRRRNVTLIQSTTSGDSLYLGKRQSEVMARIYDKGLESKTAPRGMLFRQEIEYKADRARDVVTHLRSVTDADTETAMLVSSYMRASGLQTLNRGELRTMTARGMVGSNLPKLGYLKRCVAPSVRRLIDAGRLNEVLDALGLLEYVSPLADARHHGSTEEDDQHGSQ
jgi:hypothetical protein